MDPASALLFSQPRVIFSLGGQLITNASYVCSKLFIPQEDSAGHTKCLWNKRNEESFSTMTPAFGFSAGDFIAAIEVCTKVAKALKDTGTAATEYQQVVLELQGLQNILIRLAALEPTESNIQHVNAIRGAALASTLSLQEFILKLEKFDHSMSPFAAKKPFNAAKAGRQAQYAVFMADEVKKMRAVIYGNVIRINVLLATHSSETLSRSEERQVTNHQESTEKFSETKSDMTKIIKDIEEMKMEASTYREEVRQGSLNSSIQMQELSKTTEAHNVSVTQSLLDISAGISSITTSINGVRNIGSQIISLLRLIPLELGNMIQNVIRSNARIESTLLRIDRNIPNSPSLSLDTNIRIEDALGRPHDLPFEWFQYWETFEGLLKAKFKDVPGGQKIDSGNFRLVHAKRPSIVLDKNSWSTTITPGAYIIMLMLITHIPLQKSSCPRQSCSAKIVSIHGSKDLVTCPVCDLRFVSREIPADGVEVEEVTKIQHIEDAKLFGNIGDPDVSKRITDVTEDIEMMDMSGSASTEALKTFATRTEAPVENTSCRPSGLQEPPIIGWLARTVPPKDPDSVRQWRDAAESEQLGLKEREAKELEVFRNVQIITPTEAAATNMSVNAAVQEEENDLDVGARIYYRNILDHYPRIDPSLARRCANGNWERQKRLVARQSEAERKSLRAASRRESSEGIRRRKRPHSTPALPEPDEENEWEDVAEMNDGNDGLEIDQTLPKLQASRADISPTLKMEGEAENFPARLGTNPKVQPPIGHFSSEPTQQRRQMYFEKSKGRSTDKMKVKLRRLCSLPPLPAPSTLVSEGGLISEGGSLTLCYLCYSPVYIEEKQFWRKHVMNDLMPYMCPFEGCSYSYQEYSHRHDLLAHIQSLHLRECNTCPFCGHTEFSEHPRRLGKAYVKHIGRHMEEIAFGVVSTAYEDWSYDGSGSDPDTKNGDSSPSMAYAIDPETHIGWPTEGVHSYNATGGAITRVEQALKPKEQAVIDSVDLGISFESQHDDTQFEENFWTGEMTATSSQSSANSGLRDPYPPQQPRKPIPRKGHLKTRRGCWNCKRRRIKCNEGHPDCNHCIKAGLQCAYSQQKLSPQNPSQENPPQQSHKPILSKGHGERRRACGNCRRRKIKCDKDYSGCNHCVRLGLQCEYEEA